MDDATRAAQGMTVRREVLGDAHVDRAVAGTTAFTGDFQDFITRYAWGEVWSRPGLSRAERSMLTLTALVVLRQETELATHVRAALRNGLTRTRSPRCSFTWASTRAYRPSTGRLPWPSR
jgi:alkylhydroperoxidase/carboxymuconolactone decarboxylase family protein YurZ